jgi:hypothetical protein
MDANIRFRGRNLGGLGLRRGRRRAAGGEDQEEDEAAHQNK